MIAFAGAMRLKAMQANGSANINTNHSFSVRPRWDLAELQAP
jgi:N6-L-threonylcarbamoyladenine synthase